MTEAKASLREIGAAEDALIGDLIEDAATAIEQAKSLSLVCRSYELRLDKWRRGESGREIRIPLAPLVSVTSIKYLDTAGAQQTLAADQYRVDTDSLPGRITPAYGVTWPELYPVSAAVIVRFVAGFVAPFTVASVDGEALLTVLGRPLAVGDVISLTNSGGALPAAFAATAGYFVAAANVTTRDNLVQTAATLSTTSGGAALPLTAEDAGTGQHYVGQLPGPIRRALLLEAAHLFENREAVLVGVGATELPRGVDRLLRLSDWGNWWEVFE